MVEPPVAAPFALLNHLPLPAFVNDANGTVVFVNAALARRSGAARGDLLGSGLADLVHPDDRAVPFARTAEGVDEREVRLRVSSGAYRWHRVCMQATVEGGRLAYTVGTWHDIHELKQAEAALREQRDRAAGYLRTAPFMLLVLDRRGCIETINRRGAQLLGYADADALVGRDWFDVAIPPHRRSEVRAVFTAFMTGAAQAPEAYENSVLHADGTERLFSWRNTVLRDAQGAITGTISSGEDISERKAAEARLQSSEALLSAVLDALPVGVAIADPSGRIVRDNVAHRELWGVPPDTHTWEEYGEWVGWRPDTGERLRANDWALARALLHGETVRGELVEYQPFGSAERRYFLNNAARILNADGHVIGGVIAEQDVTAQMATERALREHAQRVQLALSAGAILGTWVWNLHDDRITVDEGFATNFGLDPALGREGLTVTQVLETVHPDDIAGVTAAIGRAVARGGPYAHQYRVRRRDGRYYWIEANGRVDLAEDGVPSSFPGVLLDVEERRAVLAALRDSEARLRLATEAAAIGTWDYDLVSDDLRWDARTKELFGLPPHADVTYHTVFVPGLHPDDRDRTQAAVAAALAVDGPGEYDIEYRTVGLVDGVERWIAARGRALFEDGRAVRFIGTVLDVTERKRLEEQLRNVNEVLEGRVRQRTAELERANEELRRSNTELERFAYITSHDLQEPIRTVSSFTGLLSQRYADLLDERGRLFLAMTLQGTERMKALVDDLLAFSRLSGDQVPLRPVDLRAPLSEALARLERRLEETGARVTWDDLPTVPGDGPQLAQLFQNLVSNAVKFTRPGVAPTVHVGVEREDDVWHFTVADNGIGIEEAYLEQIFVLFRRLHTRDKYEGTGLGLGICQKVVERHGGRIWATSTPGEGSTFHFTLPAPLLA